MARQTFRILDMHCSSCALRLEALEDELPGVQSARASYARGQLVVEFDEQRLTPQEIIQAVKRIGYTAEA